MVNLVQLLLLLLNYKSLQLFLQSLAILKKRIWTIKRDYTSLFMQVVYSLLDVLLLLLLIGGNIGRAPSEEPQSWSISSFKPDEDSD